MFELTPPSDLFFGIIFLSVSAVCLGELFGDDTNIPPRIRVEHVSHLVCNSKFTLWKITMEAQNGGLKDDFPFQLGEFLGPC